MAWLSPRKPLEITPLSTHYEALARTTLLLNQEWFDGQADEAAIADALLGSTVRLAATPRPCLAEPDRRLS